MSGKKKTAPSNVVNNQAINHKSIHENILNIFRQTPNVLFNYKQIAKKLDVKDAHDRQTISEILKHLTGEEILEEVYTGKYRMISDICYVTGKVDLTVNGYGFVISDEYEEDIFVSMKNLNHALHGDIVKVYLFAKRKKARPEGEVVEIIQRARSMFVGTIEISRNFAFLIPSSKQIPFDIFIPLRNLNNAQNGQKAVVKILEWPTDAKNPIGEVIEILGFPGVHETEMHAILAEFELPNAFLPEVEEAANRLSEKISDEEYK